MIHFAIAHRDEDVRALALKRAPEGIDLPAALQLIAGYQTARRKLPTWAATWDEASAKECVESLAKDADWEGRVVLFPPRLSMEQCSSQAAAEYKRDLVRRLLIDREGGGEGTSSAGLADGKGTDVTSFADLTGGLGVDFSFMAPLFDAATYVERQAHLCRLARHNMAALGVTNADFVEGEAETVLTQLPRQTLIYLDPARRDPAGRKVFITADCQPDVVGLHDRLVAHADIVLVKLSPMLDIHDALRSLPSTSEVHVVEVRGEVKELLLVMGQKGAASPTITASGLTFTYEEEVASPVQYADTIHRYLYEPSPAIMKAGAYRTVAARFGLQKLHRDSHLYTSDELVTGFPGRVLAVAGFAAMRDARRLAAGLSHANIVCRNFPLRPDELRRRLKLKDGGDTFIYGTTVARADHLLVVAKAVPVGSVERD